MMCDRDFICKPYEHAFLCSVYFCTLIILHSYNFVTHALYVLPLFQHLFPIILCVSLYVYVYV